MEIFITAIVFFFVGWASGWGLMLLYLEHYYHFVSKGGGAPIND